MKRSVALVFFWIITLSAQHYTITLLIREYPDEQRLQDEPPNYTNMPKQLMKNTFYQPVVSGIYALYNGYFSHSDNMGVLTFPRTTQIEQFMLLVTPYVRPVFYPETFTIDHWHITRPQQATAYHIQRYKDPETKLRYWKVLQTDLPTDQAAPLHSIIIIAKPKNVHVPLGATPTTNLPNLVLPPIYARRGLDRIKNSLYLLNVKQFFAPVRMQSKTENQLREAIVAT